MICESHHLGPVTLHAAPIVGLPPTSELGPPVMLVSRSGGSAALVTFSGPMTDFSSGVPTYQGMIGTIEGRQGSRWTPLRRFWAPPFSAGSRTLAQYQGAPVDQFRVMLWLARSGISPTSWATEIRDLHVDLTVGHGASGPAPGAAFFLTGRIGSMPAGSDLVSVPASPERRRLTLELLDLGGAVGAGIAWRPLDASPASWAPLAVGVPRTYDTSAPIWVASDPPGAPIAVSVVEELA